MRAITFGEHWLFYTPEHMIDMMAQIVAGEDGTTVSDPACGSGRTLLSAANVNPRRTFVGQDLDHRHVRMCRDQPRPLRPPGAGDPVQHAGN